MVVRPSGTRRAHLDPSLSTTHLWSVGARVPPRVEKLSTIHLLYLVEFACFLLAGDLSPQINLESHSWPNSPDAIL